MGSGPPPDTDTPTVLLEKEFQDFDPGTVKEQRYICKSGW